MLPCQLIELAALISAQAETLIHSGRKLSPARAARYGEISRRRFQLWHEGLAAYRGAVAARVEPAACEDAWQKVRPILEEIITGDVLTRIWGGLLAAHDLAHGAKDLEPLAQSVLVGQIEANNRALALLVHGHQVRLDEAAALNRLRHRVERWIDLLLAPILSGHEMTLGGAALEQFAIDPERARDFSEDLGGVPGRRQFERAWPLVLASLHGAFKPELSGAAAHAELNADLAESVLGCFPPECFHASGAMRSSWLVRLATPPDETPGVVDELFQAAGRRGLRRTVERADGSRPRF